MSVFMLVCERQRSMAISSLHNRTLQSAKCHIFKISPAERMRILRIIPGRV